eukprot:11798963-Heterocapsa_arctica.AAC.1
MDHSASQGRAHPRVVRVKGGLAIYRDSPFAYPLRTAKNAAIERDLMDRQFHEIVHLTDPSSPPTD